MPDCIFCRIVSGDVPGSILYQDDQVTAFRDVNPQAPVHVLIVPNVHLANTEELQPSDDSSVAAVIRAAREVARIEGVAETGYRLVVNTGADAFNTVPHLHVHLLEVRPESLA